MIVDFAAIVVGLIAATAVVVPSVLCCWCWTRYANRRLFAMAAECDEWRAIATNATIRSHLMQQPEPPTISESDNDDSDFPQH